MHVLANADAHEAVHTVALFHKIVMRCIAKSNV